ncbi:MAG: GntR family transcriptional regulator [Lentisphaeria bacterium]|nr:GntR family transcriptional regulator [Lentisphaeria bacterium]
MEKSIYGGKTAGIREQLLRQIELGNFPRGSVLPSERELTEQLNASYMTVRKAIGTLVEEKYLERIPRVGTFVSHTIPGHKVQRQLGIVVPAWTAPENSDFVMYAGEAAEREGWLPKMVSIRHWEDRALVDAWTNFDALVCFAPQPVAQMPRELLEKFRSHEKPVVFIGVPAHHFGLDAVTGSMEVEFRIILDKLAEAGHTRIALVEQCSLMNDQLTADVPTFHSVWKQRIAETLGESAAGELSILVETPRFELPHRAIYERLRSIGPKPPFTAVITRVPFLSGVMAAFSDLGLRVPEDVSVVANGDRQELEFYRPEPTYLKVSLRDHALQAFELIKARLATPSLPVQYTMISPEFIEGKTLKSLRK